MISNNHENVTETIETGLLESIPQSSVQDLIALIRAKHEFRDYRWYEDARICEQLACNIAADLGVPYEDVGDAMN